MVNNQNLKVDLGTSSNSMIGISISFNLYDFDLDFMSERGRSENLLKVDELANSLQVCLDSGAKKVLLPITSAGDLGSVPAELIGCFNLIFYSSAEDAVFKALGVE